MKKVYAAIPPANPDVQPLMKPHYRFGVQKPGNIFFPVLLIVLAVAFYVIFITSMDITTWTAGYIVVVVLLHLILFGTLISVTALIRSIRTKAAIREEKFARKDAEYVNKVFIPTMSERYNIQNLTPYEVHSLRQGIGLALLVNGVPMTAIVTENKLGELILSDAANVIFEQKELTRHAVAGDGGGEAPIFLPAYHIDHGVHNGDGSSDSSGGWSAESSADGGSDGGGGDGGGGGD